MSAGNILFDARGTLKLCDFGLAIDLHEEIANSCVGTLHYMAPEIITCPAKDHPDQGKTPSPNTPSLCYSYAADIWALGCVAYEVMVGHPPFGGRPGVEMRDVAMQILSGDSQSVFWPPGMSNEACHFVATCLQLRQGDRPTAEQLLLHPFVRPHRRPALHNTTLASRDIRRVQL